MCLCQQELISVSFQIKRSLIVQTIFFWFWTNRIIRFGLYIIKRKLSIYDRFPFFMPGSGTEISFCEWLRFVYLQHMAVTLFPGWNFCNRRKTVWKTNTSRHHGDQSMTPPVETLFKHQVNMIQKGLRGGPNIGQTSAPLSDHRWQKLQHENIPISQSKHRAK